MRSFKKKVSFWEMFLQNGKWYVLMSLVVVNIFVWYIIFAESRGNILTVTFLDVGQGDAVLIEAPNGNQVLIDGGPNGSVLRSLSNVIPFYDRSIDVVIATHPDKDHVGGLPSVIGRFEVDFFIDPGVPSDSGVFNALTNTLYKKNVTRVIAERGQVITLDEGVYLSVLFPDRDVSRTESNNASVVVKLTYGDTEFLFTGDAPKNIEKYLVSLGGKNLQSNVLKVGHHGSKTSTGEIFLGFVSPEYAVISVGVNNRYGHPNASVLYALEQFDVSVFQTAQEGAIIFTSDGEVVRKK